MPHPAEPPASTTRPGRVAVSLDVPCSVARAWQALTDPPQLACWFGTVSGPLRTGATLRLEFGDGDFFDLHDVRAEPPTSLQYGWRFMGCGPRDVITWQLQPTVAGTRIALTDDEPGRPTQVAAELRQGWLDFTQRLEQYVRTGQRTRYDWRRQLEVSIEVEVTPAWAWDHLFGPGRLTTWLPLDRSQLVDDDARLILDDGEEPGWLRVTAARPTPPGSLDFDLAHPAWRGATHCRIALEARPSGTLLSLSHLNWEAVSSDAATQRRQRARFSHFWIARLERAAAGVPSPQVVGEVR